VLTGAYDAQHLDDPRQMETVLREIISLTPEDLAPVFRLAKVQEDEGLIDAAEATLLDARHKQPDAVEPWDVDTVLRSTSDGPAHAGAQTNHNKRRAIPRAR
jgi:hypothetical protein